MKRNNVIINVNYTDNKNEFITRYIGKSITDDFNVFKQKSKLINRLYYTTNNTTELSFIPYIRNNAYSGITITNMTNSNFIIFNYIYWIQVTCWK